MRPVFALLGLVFVLTAGVAAEARADVDLGDVGVVSLKNDGAAEAQQDFLHGLAQLHNFEYGDAAADFRAAQQIDPDFALAYWGEAMTHNHPIWMQQDREAALAVLARFAPTAEARLEKIRSELTRDLFAALDILYGTGDKQRRDDRYSAFMGELYEKYPDNVDVASFYALSLMGTAHEGRDFATYMKAAAIMQDFIVDYPRHPGVAHYLIHATDDPIHAPLGLRAAQAYSAIAPNAAHAQHMTSHIFLALGDWDGVIRANTRATRIMNQARDARGEPAAGCGHYPSWLMYGYLQQANVEQAKTIMLTCHDNVAGEARGRTQNYFAWQRALYLFDSGEWRAEVADMTADFGDNHAAAFEHRVVDGWVALKRDELPQAEVALAEAQALAEALSASRAASDMPVDPAAQEEPGVLLEQLAGAIALARGDTERGLQMLRDAAEREMSLPFGFGPPSPAKPSLELLGETLVGLERYAEAVEVLRASLQRTPNKLSSVAALAEAELQLAATRRAAASAGASGGAR